MSDRMYCIDLKMPVMMHDGALITMCDLITPLQKSVTSVFFSVMSVSLCACILS